jgi:L-iditol 2-dehydrogenase
MKAAVLYANEDIRYENFKTPVIKPGAVKVRVKAAGICGSDVPRVLYNGAHFYPIVLGHEFAGDIVEVGAGVNGVSVGDTVCGVPLLPCMKCDDCQKGNFSLCKHYSFIGSREQGSFADYVVIPAVNVVRYDPSIPYEQAAMFEPSTVALHGVFCSEYSDGNYVAILGCGTIGIFTMQWAKIFGGKKVVAFDINENRLALARRMGADEVINTSNADYMKTATEITGGKGYDYVFEAAGHPITMHIAFEIAANKAHVCFIGTPGVDISFTPKEWENLNRKEFKLTGSWMGYSAPFPGKEWELTAHYLATGQLKFDPEFIYRKFPMGEAGKAFALYHNPAGINGRIMLINE